MSALIHPVQRTILTKKKPRIIYSGGGSSASTSLVLDLPFRGRRGLLHLMFAVRAFGGTVAPSLPSGWTSLQTSTTAPAYRVAYLFSTGAEAATFTTTATGATSMAATVYTIEGVDPSFAPTINTAVTSLNSGSGTPANLGKEYLYIVYAMTSGVVDMDTEAAVTAWPTGYDFHRQVKGRTGAIAGGVASASRGVDVYKTEDPSAFTLSGTPTSSRSGLVMVPGFY